MLHTCIIKVITTWCLFLCLGTYITSLKMFVFQKTEKSKRGNAFNESIWMSWYVTEEKCMWKVLFLFFYFLFFNSTEELVYTHKKNKEEKYKEKHTCMILLMTMFF